MGIVALVFLPDQPSTAKFLDDPEKVIAAKRVSANRQGIKNRHFKSYQVWQTVKDPKTWILFVMAVGAQVSLPENLYVVTRVSLSLVYPDTGL